MTAIGALLLFMALTSAQVQRLPLSTSLLYLIVGVVVGPLGFGLMRLDLDSQRVWLETLTEVAVIVSLFVGGLRLRLPLGNPSWRTAVMLAGPMMLLCIAGTAAAAYFVLGVPVFVALLLGAILAPTDPVLASAVSVNDADDHDRVRFALSGEAGLNDGTAFPFVIFALTALREGRMGSWGWSWVLEHVIWAIPVGILVGYVLGDRVGRFAIRVRSAQRDTSAPSDFLTLALVALAYVAAERLHSNGFLAVFAAGVGLRHAELRVVADSPHPDARKMVRDWIGSKRRASQHPPAETLVPPRVTQEAIEEPAVAAGVLISEVLSFGDTVERLLEVLLVVLVGIALSQAWSLTGALLALLLFLVIRPAAAYVSLRGTRTTRAQRYLLGWFGIRGIGSLYYASYALNHGLPADMTGTVASAVITVVACSIVVYGISVTPITRRHERRHITRAV